MAGEQIPQSSGTELNMKLLRDVLFATGYRTLEATTGAERSSWLRHRFPISFSWTSNFPTDGVQALHRLRANGLRPPSPCSP
jgi:hypothetical protein